MSDLPKMYRVEGPGGEIGDLVIWPKGQEPQGPVLDPDADQTCYDDPAEARAAALKYLAKKAARASKS